ncbi:histone-lysine N-methyltransferase SETMAR-like [Vespa velutina]|uniref:histone-lysine N-methyltransferase SETMAR-like n=1 Tax=Vespa velutina TaxID=202808 RepID=UPI001FB3F0D4|nr:histone-lysine N-methyltransferase SETMAR-like [Vespa velutina]
MFKGSIEKRLRIYCFVKKKFLLSLNKMADYQLTEEYIRHCMLCYFQLGFNATITTKKICHVYGNILKANEWRYWFRKFARDDFDLFHSIRNLRSTELDSDILKSLIEQDPRLTMKEIADALLHQKSTTNN